jgi:hypothetical protein
MSLSTLRLLLPERPQSPVFFILSNSITFSFKNNPFIHSILKEVIKPTIKQKVLDRNGPSRRVLNKYINSSNNKDKKAKSITIVF